MSNFLTKVDSQSVTTELKGGNADDFAKWSSEMGLPSWDWILYGSEGKPAPREVKGGIRGDNLNTDDYSWREYVEMADATKVQAFYEKYKDLENLWANIEILSDDVLQSIIIDHLKFFGAELCPDSTIDEFVDAVHGEQMMRNRGDRTKRNRMELRQNRGRRGCGAKVLAAIGCRVAGFFSRTQ